MVEGFFSFGDYQSYLVGEHFGLSAFLGQTLLKAGATELETN